MTIWAVEYRCAPDGAYQLHVDPHAKSAEDAGANFVAWFDGGELEWCNVLPIQETQLFTEAMGELSECATMADVDAVLGLAYPIPALAQELRDRQLAKRELNLHRLEDYRRRRAG